MTKCSPGCACARHSRSKDTYKSGSKKCEPGCTCARHNRKPLSEGSRANIAAANKARAGESHRCPPDCTCAKHQAYYRGGSKPGRVFSKKARDNMSEGARNREYTPEYTEKLAALMRERHQDPEWEQNRIDALINYWKNVVSPEDLSRGVKRSSRHEFAVAPYMAALGYTHNEGVGQLKIGRKTPDFIDVRRQRIYEYLGVYWHPDRDEAQQIIDYYSERGWACTVLWEDDSLEWAVTHEALVSEEDHQNASRILNDTKRLKLLR